MTREEALEFGNMWLQVNEDCKDSNTYAFFQIAIQALKQEPCDDCISRQAVLDKMKERDEELSSICPKDIRELPPVTPQPKMGKWIKTSLTEVSGGDFKRGFKCSHCGYVIVTNDFNFCPNCGEAKIQEVEE